MSNFKFTETYIKGLYIVEQKIFEDERGYFMESYNSRAFKEAGLDLRFVQDNQSKSQKGVLRGLHFQKKHPQGKLVRVLTGEVFDVAVDLRKNSSTFKKWFGCILNHQNRKQLYVPEGFAHGFLVLSDEAELAYKCTDFYYPNDEGGYMWNDPEFNIGWPLECNDNVILSNKDSGYDLFSAVQFSYDII